MIEIKNLYAGYFKREVLKNINAVIKRDSFTGIIGGNGAGKSTLLKVLCKTLKCFSGNIYINTVNINNLSRKDMAKLLCFMPQDNETFFSFTVREFISMGRYPYGNLLKAISERDYKIVDEVMEFLNISFLSNENINELSGGERQKVLIAQTIVQETDILIFDEPIAHLDIGAQYSILNILRTLNEQKNKTIIITMHDLNAAGEFCSDIILMDNGKIKNCGSPEEVLNYQDIEDVYKTKVIVKTNPISQKPYVIPIGKINL
jgi:iron complex transport system ATP-binding protein